MAKKDEQKANELGRVKFRYADTDRYFDLDVDNIRNESGVVDGLKSIASALAGRNLTIAPNRALVGKPANGSPNGAQRLRLPLQKKPKLPIRKCWHLRKRPRPPRLQTAMGTARQSSERFVRRSSSRPSTSRLQR